MKKIERPHANHSLIEIAWEVCNQVGGIHTVIKSKIPIIAERYQDHYVLVGPYFRDQAMACFDQVKDQSYYKTPVGAAVKQLQSNGLEAYLGRWLVLGKPLVVLLNPASMMPQLDRLKYFLWHSHFIGSDQVDPIFNEALCFGAMIKAFLEALIAQKNRPHQIIAHFHEWISATCLPDIRKDNLPITTVFTTHATLLARYLAMHDDNFYNNLERYNWEYEAKRLLIESPVKMERAAAHGAHVFTTVSHVTARECAHLLGREPDLILPNGLNIERFTALHEFQNLHQRYKLQIHEFVAGHFFPSYTFDLDQTLYFFTSGRYEFKNKGFDMTLEALRRLNLRMREERIDKTVVMFFITKRPNRGVLANVLQRRAVTTEIKRSCSVIEQQIGNNIFNALVSSRDNRVPDLNQFVDESFRLRLRRILQSWRTHDLPHIVTHDMYDQATDEILCFLRYHQLINNEGDRVKVVYHPDFLSPSSPLLPLEYEQFVRGCHLGLFASSYEPWGYTPLECIASGVPAVTTDLAGFGDYSLKNNKKYICVINRTTQNFNDSTEEMVAYLLDFVKKSQRARITFRNKVESSSTAFDWSLLIRHYEDAYALALARL